MIFDIISSDVQILFLHTRVNHQYVNLWVSDQSLCYDQVKSCFSLLCSCGNERRLRAVFLWIQPRLKKNFKASLFSIFQLEKFWRNILSFCDRDNKTLSAVNFHHFSISSPKFLCNYPWAGKKCQKPRKRTWNIPRATCIFSVYTWTFSWVCIPRK